MQVLTKFLSQFLVLSLILSAVPSDALAPRSLDTNAIRRQLFETMLKKSIQSRYDVTFEKASFDQIKLCLGEICETDPETFFAEFKAEGQEGQIEGMFHKSHFYIAKEKQEENTPEKERKDNEFHWGFSLPGRGEKITAEEFEDWQTVDRLIPHRVKDPVAFRRSTLRERLEAFRPLTEEEYLKLATEVQRGNSAARQAMVESRGNRMLRWARIFASPETPVDDLLQVEFLALLNAVSGYNGQIIFSSVSAKAIRSALVEYLGEERAAQYQIPANLIVFLPALAKFEKEIGHPPSWAEIMTWMEKLDRTISENDAILLSNLPLFNWSKKALNEEEPERDESTGEELAWEEPEADEVTEQEDSLENDAPYRRHEGVFTMKGFPAQRGMPHYDVKDPVVQKLVDYLVRNTAVKDPRNWEIFLLRLDFVWTKEISRSPPTLRQLGKLYGGKVAQTARIAYFQALRRGMRGSNTMHVVPFTPYWDMIGAITAYFYEISVIFEPKPRYVTRAPIPTIELPVAKPPKISPRDAADQVLQQRLAERGTPRYTVEDPITQRLIDYLLLNTRGKNRRNWEIYLIGNGYVRTDGIHGPIDIDAIAQLYAVSAPLVMRALNSKDEAKIIPDAQLALISSYFEKEPVLPDIDPVTFAHYVDVFKHWSLVEQVAAAS